MSPRPTWIYLLLQPLSRLPHSFTWYTILNGVMLIACFYLIEKSHPLIALTMPVFWTLFYGQIDSWVATGAVLGVWALKNKHPLWLGLALLLLTSKPHIGLPLALFLLWRGWNWKALLVPGFVAGISFIVYGFWPVKFLQSIQVTDWMNYTEQAINISLWPWALLVLPVIALRWKKMTNLGQAISILAATSLVIPYSPAYSLLALVFLMNEWPLLLLLVLPAWFGRQAAMVFGMLFTGGSLLIALFEKARPEVKNQDFQSK